MSGAGVGDLGEGVGRAAEDGRGAAGASECGAEVGGQAGVRVRRKVKAVGGDGKRGRQRSSVIGGVAEVEQQARVAARWKRLAERDGHGAEVGGGEVFFTELKIVDGLSAEVVSVTEEAREFSCGEIGGGDQRISPLRLSFSLPSVERPRLWFRGSCVGGTRAARACRARLGGTDIQGSGVAFIRRTQTAVGDGVADDRGRHGSSLAPQPGGAAVSWQRTRRFRAAEDIRRGMASVHYPKQGRSVRMSAVYDLIVIGSGPSGQRAAIYGAKLGKKVALVEMREVVGGACISTGTIPSKTMREAVLHLSGYNYKSIYGMNYRVKERITMADLAFRVQHVIKTEIDVTEAQLSRNNIEVLVGTASFEDATHVKVTNSRGTQIYEAKSIIIGTGTKPASSTKVPINGSTIVNSDLILELKNLPKTMIVVGGGVIGVEYTCMFAALGVRVTLIERRPRLLEFADQEIVEALSYHLRDSRVTMRLNEEVESVEEMADGSVVAALESKKRLQGDALLYAVGRQGNVDELNLAAIGVDSDSRGRIPVDKDFRTKCPTVFAVGDVIGFPSLASVSMEQGRVAAARAFGDETVLSNPSFYPYGIWTIPEISFLGKTEEQLTEEDVPYEVGVAYYREIARGQIRGDTTGRLKLIFHRQTHAILGVHIIGEGASELLHIGQAVMALGGKLDYFVDTVFNYPTLAECYKVAAFNGLNRVSKFE